MIGQADQGSERSQWFRWKAEESHEIPEQKLQQQRDLSDQSHIQPRKLTEQRIEASPGCPRADAQQRCQQDAEGDHAETVEPAHHQSPGCAVSGLVGKSVFAECETCRLPEPFEAQAEARADQVHGEVVDQKSHKRENHDHQKQFEPAGASPFHWNGGAVITPPSRCS